MALIFGSSYEAIKRNKSLTILLAKRPFKYDQFADHKDKGDLIL